MAAEVAPLSSVHPTQSATKSPPPPFEPASPDSSAISAANPAANPSANGSVNPAAEAPRLSPQDAVDFLLHPVEVARGRTAAESVLESFRNDESRRTAEEALETLATVISGGRCDSVEFPWHQVRPFHGAAALTILKERGAPARIEALRCRRDTTRSYRVVPETYPPAQVQKIRTTLSKVIEQCTELGYIQNESEEDAAKATATGKTKTRTKTAAQGRLLGDGELRALGAASAASANAEGHRDAVLFALVNRGLKIAEITALSIDSVRFSNKTGICNIVSPATNGSSRGRRVELSNDELICLEDWLDHRGDNDGPLLCTLGRGGKVEGKRLTMALLKEICERRSKQAEVADFVPKDLSRSAEALTDHRKALRKKVKKETQGVPTSAEELLFEGRANTSDSEAGEAIRFPFLGLGI